MTALCSGGGPSQVIPGVLGNLVYAAGGAGIFSVTPGAQWLAAVASSIGILTYQASVLCATDPPAMPTFSSGDYLALLIADPGPAGHTARQKVQDALANILWPSVCECVSGPQPGPATPPSNPSGSTYVPPVQVSPTCAPTFTYISGSALGTGTLNRSGPTVPVGIVPTSFHYHIIASSSNTNVGTYTWAFKQLNAASGVIQTDTFTVNAPNDTQDHTVNVAAGCVAITLTQTYVSGTGPNQFITNSTIDWYCGSNIPGAVASPCCPPDPTTLATLQSILGLVTVIQRQIAPFAYVPGAAHSGLSGTGSFAVSGILGLAVDITTAPARLGTIFGDPDQVFGAGWINVGTADGWGPREFISSDPFLLRPVPGDITLVGYSIPADVTVTITELIREP